MQPYTWVVGIYVFAILISLFVMIMAVYRRRAPKSLYFAFMAITIFLYTYGYYVEITSTCLDMAMAGTRMQYLGLPFIAPLVFMFILDYCGHPMRMREILAIMVVPIIACMFVQIPALTGLYYRQIIFDAGAPVPHLIVYGTAVYYAYFVYMALLLISATAVAIYHYGRGDAIYKRQTAVLIIALATPTLGSSFFLVKSNLIELDLSPLLLSVSCLLLSYMFLRMGFFQIAPIARDHIMERMSDGFVLMDMQGRYVDANPQALRIIPQLANVSIGASLRGIPAIPWVSQEDGSLLHEFTVKDKDGALRNYRTSETGVQHEGKPICRCILFYDVTAEKKLLDEVSEMAERDALTGLINRGTFFRRAEALFAQMAASGGQASVLMMDLDFFKRVNDTHGHLVGDEVLSTIARRLSERLRSTDLFARYGGEELCALLPGAGRDAAAVIAEQLRRSMEQLQFKAEEGTFRVTISIGIGVYDGSRHKTLQALLAEADRGLYDAKKDGRNRIVIGGPT